MRDFHNATIAAVRRGHIIANHTESHRRMTALSAREQHQELLVAMQWFSKYDIPRPLLFRAPFRSFDQATLAQVQRLKMLTVHWSVESRDFTRPGVQRIVENVVSAARPGAIILMHDDGGDRSQTAAAIPAIVKRLRAKRYRFVTVPQLLHDDPPPAGPPRSKPRAS